MYEITINTDKYSLEEFFVNTKSKKHLTLNMVRLDLLYIFLDDNVCDRVTLPL